ncbi:MAG: hypothetical protein IJ731_07035, partial [Eubacterium sp.]|nr:hypothetical protein [Eubacterium sp.]
SFSCERELYKGTAPEQKTKSAKIPENSMFSGILILIFNWVLRTRSVESAIPYKYALKKHLRGFVLCLQSESSAQKCRAFISF